MLQPTHHLRNLLAVIALTAPLVSATETQPISGSALCAAAEALPGLSDSLANDSQRAKFNAGNYLGRELWLAEVPKMLQQVAETGQADLRSPSGFTALQAACRLGDAGLALALIDAGADVNARPADWKQMGYPGHTPLGMLVSFSNRMSEEDMLKVVHALLERGADPDAPTMTRIWDNAQEKAPFEINHGNALRRLLLRYGNRNLEERTRNWDFSWWTMSDELIRDLLEGGVHPDSHVGEKGATLMVTLIMDHPNSPALVKLALSKGADIRLGKHGRYYFSDYLFCLRPNHQVHPGSAREIVRLMLDAGADINALNHRGESLRIYFGRFNTAASRAVGDLLRARGARLHPDAR